MLRTDYIELIKKGSKEKDLTIMLLYYFNAFILLLAFCCILFSGTAEAQVAGKITKVEGRVDILQVEAIDAVPAKAGDTVKVGDIIRTKSDGRAEILFIDNTKISIGPKSRLGIDEYLFKPDEEKRAASLKLYRGRMGFQVPKPVYPAEGSKFEMKTRTAVAGVRGTEGILYTDGIERVYVKDGVIELKNPLGSVTVSKGEVGEVFYGKAPVERPYSDKEYQQQEKQVSPAPPGKAESQPAEAQSAEAPPAEPSPPPAAAPPEAPEIALQPLPPPDLPKIREVTLNKIFTLSANILDGEIQWFCSPSYEETAAVIQSGFIAGTFNQTILEGGYYNLSMSGSYAWDNVRSIEPSTVYAYNATDDWFYFFYSGSTDGKLFYGASVGDIDVSNKSWSGGNLGWIEDGLKKYWYLGNFSGSYTNVFYDNNYGDRIGQSGTFSASAYGFFWDGSKPFWEQFSKIIPTLPAGAPEFFVPITETALRTFDISFNPGQSLALKDTNSNQVGTLLINSGLTGKGIELTPGSGLFDVNINGSWSVSSGNITNLQSINGTISGYTSISTNFTMRVNGGVRAIDSNTAIVGAFVGKDDEYDASGMMIGKMTGSTSGAFEGKAIGEIKSGFMLPAVTSP